MPTIADPSSLVLPAPVASVEVLEVDPHGEEIEETVRWISERVNQAIHTTCVEIGQYLLDRFFLGSVQAFRSQSPRKHSSMRALKARCESEDLPLSITTLYNYISLAIQERAMSAHQAMYARLGHTHKILLLPLRDPEIKALLVEEAVTKRLGTRQLKERVEEARRKEVGLSERGRPLKNSILYTLDRLEQALGARAIDSEHFLELRRTGEYQAALDRAEAIHTRLNAVLSALRRHRPRRRPPTERMDPGGSGPAT